VHARLVIPEQPIEDFVLGLTNGFKAFSLQPFSFQRRKQCLAGRVILAVALAAHRSGDAALLEQLAKLMAGVLAAAIAMEDRPGTSIRTAVQPGHLQRIDDQMAAHLRLHRPAHHAAPEQVDDHGQEKPALVGI
jgi:hypothetical protein